MTVCLAAVCDHKGKGAVACCTDMQVTLGGDYVKAQDSYKFAYFGSGTILKAGRGGDADELIALIQPILDAYNDAPKPANEFDVRISRLLADLRKVVARRKADMIETFLSLDYGISVADFRQHGAEWYPTTRYETILHEIKTLKLECELICVYADDSEPIIIEITQSGDVIWQDHYACIGSGSTIALAILAQSDWYATPSVMDCLARLYLAKMTAESDPYVGIRTLFDLCIEGEYVDDLSDKGREYLAKHVKRISAPGGLPFKDEFLGITHSTKRDDRPSQKTEVESEADKAVPTERATGNGGGAAA